MRYGFHPEALDEYAQAVQYYMQQQTETAQAFINVVEDVIFRIRESPMRWPILDGDIRRCLTQKFPYAMRLIRILCKRSKIQQKQETAPWPDARKNRIEWMRCSTNCC